MFTRNIVNVECTLLHKDQAQATILIKVYLYLLKSSFCERKTRQSYPEFFF